MLSPEDGPEEQIKDTLGPTEVHPAARDALDYLKSLTPSQMSMLKEAFASCTIEGNRLSEVCLGTLNRLTEGAPVSDRYLLGLAWATRSILNN